ncbi:NAD(P)/FAD-dependent oxidoreductase [Xylophilus sp. Kf1]|nr:NAD(P)/FAD-dependent oxidoreductase [Xylophilus sp. Kf1]
MQVHVNPDSSSAAAGGTPARDPAARPRVVIVGCGFGGLEAARALRDAPVDITLIDRANHHLFQPLLYQVATAGLAAPSISAPVRNLFRHQPNVTVLLAEAVGIDPATRSVSLADHSSLHYDHLIVAAGAGHGYFGHDEWAAYAPGLKTLEDAFRIRRRVLLAFEAAERETDPVARKALLTFVVIGAGPTGVEMAGTLTEIARLTLPGEFRNIDPASAQVLLIEGGPRVLASFPETLSEKARLQLVHLGVEVRTGTRVTHIDRNGLQAQAADGTAYRIPSRCMVWAAGVAASPLARLLGEATGATVDRAGRVAVEPDLSLPGHPDISVVGDMAAALSHRAGETPRPVPGVSPGAKQMGRAAAANLLLRLQGRPTLPFNYADYGNLATVGRRAAVVDLAAPWGPLRFSGTSAWLFWLFAHIYFLIGFRNRIGVLLDWASAYFQFQRPARIVVGVQHPAPGQPPAEPRKPVAPPD